MHCEDCGTKLELNGTCPNCHEELFIATWQATDLDYPISEEFAQKVEEQAAVVARRRRWREHDIQETEFGL
jgi:hypothetical protein